MEATPSADATARQLLQAQTRLGASQSESAAKRLHALAQGRASGENTGLREAAQEFEATFLTQMLKPMFKGLSTDGPFGGGHAEKIYRSMLVKEIGTEIGHAGGIGIADEVYEQLLRLQEA